MKELKSLKEFEKLEHELMVIDFSATWCGPCRMISPIFERMSEDYKKISFYKVDIDTAQDLAKNFNVTGLPTFIFFKNNEIVDDLKLTGANRQKLKDNLDSLLEL